jgi:heme oxygenase (mycobilin-producing)
MCVAMSCFRVRSGQEAMTGDAFRRRPHVVDKQPGFVRREVLSPETRPNEFWLITFWQDRESFETWHPPSSERITQPDPPGPEGRTWFTGT